MGKKNFGAIYRDACTSLGLQAGKIKISHFCDTYHPDKNYAGIILYHKGGKFKWKNSKKSVAGGYNCQLLYVYIRCTDEWSGSDFKNAGQGRVHDKMFKEMFGVSFKARRSCCGGFAMMKGTRKYSSIWLNQQESKRTKLTWESDGSQMLSAGETMIVNLALDNWMTEGIDRIVEIPSWMHEMILEDVMPSVCTPESNSSETQTSSHGRRRRTRRSTGTIRYQDFQLTI